MKINLIIVAKGRDERLLPEFVVDVREILLLAIVTRGRDCDSKQGALIGLLGSKDKNVGAMAPLR